MQKVKKMGTKIMSALVLMAAFTGVGAMYSPTVSALDCAILPNAICGKANDGGTSGGVFELLKWVLRIMIGVVGIAAVGGMIWSGILYLSASDNAAQVKQAKTVIVDVVIGLTAFALMFLIINWLIPGGVLK